MIGSCELFSLKNQFVREFTPEEQRCKFQEYNDCQNENEKIEILKCIVEHNLRLAMRMAIKIGTTYTNIDVQDLFQEACVALNTAVRTFDTAKGSEFSSYACKCIENKLLRYCKIIYREHETTMKNCTYVNKENEEVVLGVEDLPDVGDISVQDDYTNKEIVSKVINYIYTIENERDRNILIDLWGLEDGEVKHYSTIADKYNLSHTTISNISNKYLRKIKKLINCNLFNNMPTFQSSYEEDLFMYESHYGLNGREKITISKLAKMFAISLSVVKRRLDNITKQLNFNECCKMEN